MSLSTDSLLRGSWRPVLLLGLVLLLTAGCSNDRSPGPPVDASADGEVPKDVGGPVDADFADAGDAVVDAAVPTADASVAAGWTVELDEPVAATGGVTAPAHTRLGVTSTGAVWVGYHDDAVPANNTLELAVRHRPPQASSTELFVLGTSLYRFDLTIDASDQPVVGFFDETAQQWQLAEGSGFGQPGGGFTQEPLDATPIAVALAGGAAGTYLAHGDGQFNQPLGLLERVGGVWYPRTGFDAGCYPTEYRALVFDPQGRLWSSFHD